MSFNAYGVWAIYRFEMARALRTFWQSIVTPVITTALYFVVFGSAIGSRMTEIDGVAYGAFIVPGLIMMNVLPDCSGLQMRVKRSHASLSEDMSTNSVIFV